jgi:short-subunit dehydrogenase involved in D-alanine esterification of teichoic acids
MTQEQLEELLDDEIPVYTYVTLNFNINQCDCCGRRGLKRTINILSKEFNDLNLGVICAGKWFNVNLTGNPHKATKRLQNKLNSFRRDKLLSVVEDVAEASREWR